MCNICYIDYKNVTRCHHFMSVEFLKLVQNVTNCMLTLFIGKGIICKKCYTV